MTSQYLHICECEHVHIFPFADLDDEIAHVAFDCFI